MLPMQVPPMPVDFFDFSNPSQIILVAGFFLSLVTAVITKKMASSQVKSFVTLTLAVVLAVLATLVGNDGEWDFRGFGNAFLTAYLPAIGAYYGLWKHNAVTRALTEKTADFGVLIQKRDIETETRPGGPGPATAITEADAVVLEEKNVEPTDADVVTEEENFTPAEAAPAAEETSFQFPDYDVPASRTAEGSDPVTGEGVQDHSLEEAKTVPYAVVGTGPGPEAEEDTFYASDHDLEDGRLWLNTRDGWVQYLHRPGQGWVAEEI